MLYYNYCSRVLTARYSLYLYLFPLSHAQVMQCDIPTIVRSCVLAITEHGMDMEGIFRVPGPAQHVDDLRKAFEDGKHF